MNGISDAVSVSQQQQQQQQLQQNLSDKICFNFGKELYVYSYRGVKKVSSHIYSNRNASFFYK